MKKQWNIPEVTCLSIKQTESMWGGSGVDTSSWTSTTRGYLQGTLSGNTSFDQHLIDIGEAPPVAP